MKKIVVGNWKLNGTLEKAVYDAKLLSETLHKENINNVIVGLCPPYLYIPILQQNNLYKNFYIGAQDCSVHEQGSFTGEVSANMLSDFNINYVVLGHSERRKYFFESNETIKKKKVVAHKNSLTTIICVGETQEERDNGNYLDIIKEQITSVLSNTNTHQNTIFAYEPVWAIGTGNTPSMQDIERMHLYIKNIVGKSDSALTNDVVVLYGGSVDENNSKPILRNNNVGGVLVGSRSLEVDHFLKIIKNAHDAAAIY